jgi:hypothetical protein
MENFFVHENNERPNAHKQKETEMIRKRNSGGKTMR